MAALMALALLAVAGAASQAAPGDGAGQVYGFGYNRYGGLGNTTNIDTMTSVNPTPALVSLPGATGAVTQIASGYGHSLVLTATDQLYAFGYNYWGQLGSTTNNNPSIAAVPTPTIVTLPGKTGVVTQIAAGEDHSLVLTSTGQLFAFGENRYGQLGIAANSGTTNANPTPTLVTLPGATGAVTQIAAGGSHSLVLTATNQLYAFGLNRSGQLGNATNNNALTANPTPTLVTLPGATGVVTQIAGGAAHSLVTTSTGQLFAFGYNYFGQLGNATNNGALTANPTPTLVTLPGATGPPTQVVGGGEHSLVLTATGQLFAFGYNYYGQLGNTTNNIAPNTANPTPVLVGLPGAAGVVTQISAGSNHSVAVTSAGQLYAFGSNISGQIGTATNSGVGNANPTPVVVGLPAGTTIDTVARGSFADHTLALVGNLAVSSGSLPAAQVGVAYSASALAAGGRAPFAWTASGLPAGLSINATSGQIRGTPTASGSANVVLTVTDVHGLKATRASLVLVVAPAKPTTKPPVGSSNARIKASLLAQLIPKGKSAKIGALLKKKSYSMSFKALTAGKLVINWYYAPRGAKRVLIAAGSKTFRAAGTQSIAIKLTARGKQLLKNTKRVRKLRANGTFTPRGARAITATKSFTLTR